MEIARRFIFHGHACAYSGRLYRPDDITIASPASAVLSVAGGLAEAVAKRQRFAPYLTVGKASVSTHGKFDDRKGAVAMTHGRLGEDDLMTSTVCSAEVDDIVMDSKRFVVAHLRAGLIAASPAKGNEPPIRLARQTTITGVSMDGHALRVTLDLKRFHECTTFDMVARTGKAKGGPVFEQHENLIYTSIVKELRWIGKPHPTATLDGHCLYVPDFGRVFFGEMLIDRSSRRLTLLRAHLGSPIGLRVGFADVGSNGSWYPPTT
jgi:hypothetical protein